MTGGLDLLAPDALGRWMDERELPGTGEPIVDAEILTGGASNAIFRFERGGHRMVLRRPPRDPRPDSAKTNLREGRLLEALAGTDVPHPGLIARCDDPDVIGDVFYLMELIEGFNPGGDLPEPFRSDPDHRHRMGIELIDGIARLALVDHRAVGLVGYGKPEGFLERQPRRWEAQLHGYRSLDGYDGRVLHGFEAVRDWLGDHIPGDYRPGIIHGDYQLANVLFASDRPELVAIIDWELSTIGDPLVDLGWILATWQDPDDPLASASYVRPWEGFPTRREMVDRYLCQVDRDPGSLLWFRVLACYKLGILLEGHWARAEAGMGDREIGEVMRGMTDRLFAQAVGLIAD